MNRDQKLLEEAYKLICEGEEISQELTNKEKELFENISADTKDILSYYKEMLIKTIRLSTKGYISYKIDKNRTVMANLTHRLHINLNGRIHKFVSDFMGQEHHKDDALRLQLVNVLFSILTSPFSDFFLSTDENDDLFISLSTTKEAADSFNRETSDSFDYERIERKLPDILRDWFFVSHTFSYKMPQKYIDIRKRQIHIDKNLSKELDADFGDFS